MLELEAKLAITEQRLHATETALDILKTELEQRAPSLRLLPYRNWCQFSDGKLLVWRLGNTARMADDPTHPEQAVDLDTAHLEAHVFSSKVVLRVPTEETSIYFEEEKPITVREFVTTVNTQYPQGFCNVIGFWSVFLTVVEI